MHYFLHDNGGWMTVSGDTAVFAVVPDGYHEVTEEEYHAAAGTIILPLPQDPPAEDEPIETAQAAAAPAKARRAKAN